MFRNYGNFGRKVTKSTVRVFENHSPFMYSLTSWRVLSQYMTPKNIPPVQSIFAQLPNYDPSNPPFIRLSDGEIQLHDAHMNSQLTAHQHTRTAVTTAKIQKGIMFYKMSGWSISATQIDVNCNLTKLAKTVLGMHTVVRGDHDRTVTKDTDDD